MGDVSPVAMSRAEREEAARRRSVYYESLYPAAPLGDTYATAPLSPREATNTAPNPRDPRFWQELKRDRATDRLHGLG
jgi:hypothetical protein